MRTPSITRIQSWLREIPLFDECSDEELAVIDGLLTELAVEAGADLTVEGSAGTQFVIIAEGWGDVLRAGKRVAVVGPGALVGELAVLDGARRAATVTARTDMRVLVGSPRDLYNLMDVPSVAAKVRAIGSAHRHGGSSLFDVAPRPLPAFRRRTTEVVPPRRRGALWLRPGLGR